MRARGLRIGISHDGVELDMEGLLHQKCVMGASSCNLTIARFTGGPTRCIFMLSSDAPLNCRSTPYW